MLLYLLPNQAHPQLSKILTLEPIRDLVAAPFRHIDVSHLFNRSFQGKVAQPRCERSTKPIRVGGRCLLLFLFGGHSSKPKLHKHTFTQRAQHKLSISFLSSQGSLHFARPQIFDDAAGANSFKLFSSLPPSVRPKDD